MNKLIKMSITLVLFVGFLSIDPCNTYAKKATTKSAINKTSQILTSDVSPPSCKMENLTLVLVSWPKEGFNFVSALLDPTCEPGSFRIGNTIVIVDSDCNVIFIPAKEKA